VSDYTELKARQMLIGNRVRIRRVDGDLVQAIVQGEHGTYEAGFDGQGWYCTCRAYRDREPRLLTRRHLVHQRNRV
jgi:hypothetical protein